PVTSVDGFEVGQKIALGYGATYPTVSRSMEKYEVVTVTAVGKPGTQAYLSMDAKAGDTNIKVSSVANISVGDTIRLDIASKGHGIETVTVKRVGTQSVRNTFDGPLKANEDAGTGLDLVEPLKFNHASNIPFSARGTGITFEPATAFPHSSNEPVLPLGTGVTLDRPLAKNHAIHDVVRDQKVVSAGYQGATAPNHWFGGPTLASNSGMMVLRDAAGRTVDGLNYGGLVDPWVAEGYQGASGASENGNSVTSPAISRGFRWWMPSSAKPGDRSAGRYPDGADNDNNRHDFLVQNATHLLAASVSGAGNIKVATVADFSIGQKIIVGTGTNSEEAVIALLGTSGGTTLSAATQAGAKVMTVASMEGLSVGQTITIDDGDSKETAVIASITPGRPRFGSRMTPPVDSIALAMPLAREHAIGAQVSGSGLTLASPLTKAHETGSPVSSNLPTPGAPNQYARKQ
ncbi:MAG TPA: alpha-N-arabinofuranosidase, partial [Bacteroidota bacterium]|nr:alpha-N-arabinofuranosidase [Bacteroidota bacterium]